MNGVIFQRVLTSVVNSVVFQRIFTSVVNSVVFQRIFTSTVLLIVLFFREYLQDLVGECLEEVSQEGSFEGLIRATVEEREKKNKLQETILRWVNWSVIGY